MNNLRVNESTYLSDLVILKCIKERLKGAYRIVCVN